MVTEDAGSALREIFDIQGRLLRNPYGMVTGAAGIGFVLGGGLFTRLAARLLGTSVRIVLMAALPTLQKQLAEAFAASKLKPHKETNQ
jgi:hypothetical protein